MNRRSYNSQNVGKNQARMARVKDKLAQLRERVKRSTIQFYERRQRRLAWWQTAFRTPMSAGRWVFSQAKTLWSAFLAILGLAPSRRASLASRSSDIRRSKRSLNRGLRHESLEGRQLLAADITGITLLDGDPTNDTTPSFDVAYTGAVDGDVVDVKINGSVVSSYTLDLDGLDGDDDPAAGTLTLESSAISGDGTKTVTVEVNNAADSDGDASFELDTTSNQPTIANASDDVGTPSTLNDGDSTNDDTPTLNGTADPDVTVEIFDGVTSVGSTTSTSSGAWSVTTTALTQGLHTFKAVATDSLGNVSSDSADFDLTVDTDVADPTLTFVDTGESNSDGITNNGLVTVGNLEAGGSWEYTVDGATWVAGVGSSFTLAEGTYAISDIGVRQTDAVGNESAEVFNAAAIEVDLTKPAGYTAVAQTASGNTTLVNFAAAETTKLVLTSVPADVVRYSLVVNSSGGGTISATNQPISVVANAATISPIDVSGLNSGTLTYTLFLKDDAGNVQSSSTTDQITLDLVRPEVTSISASPSTIVKRNGSTTITVNFTRDPGSSFDESDVTILANGTADITAGTLTMTPGTGLTREFTYTARNGNAAGGVQLEEISVEVGTDWEDNVAGNSPEAEFTSGVLFEQDTRLPTVNNFAVLGGGAAGSGTGRDADSAFNSSSTVSTVRFDIVEDHLGSGTAMDPYDSSILDLDITDLVVSSDGSSIVPVTGVTLSNLRLDTNQPSSTETRYLVDVTADAGINAAQFWIVLKDAAEGGDWTDQAGNETSSGRGARDAAFFVDTATPDTPVIITVTDNQPNVLDPLVSGDTTNDTTPTFVGTSEANAVIEVSIDDGTLPIVVETVAADGSGDWSFTPTTPLTNGETYTITFTAADLAENVSAPTTDFVLTIDTVDPTEPTISTPSGVTNVATATIDGTADAGTTVSIGSESTTADGSGNWSLSITLATGANSIAATSTDAAGNSDTSTSITITLDQTAPATPSITAVEADGPVALMSGDSTNDQTPTISGLAPDTDGAAASVTIYNGVDVIGTATVVAGAWTFTPSTDLAEGTYNLTVKAVDAAGNVSDESTPAFELTIDVSAPAVPVITTPVSPVSNITSLSGTAVAGVTVNVTVVQSGSTSATYSGTATLSGTNWNVSLTAITGGLIDGDTYEVSVSAEDGAGNESAAATKTFISDKTAPNEPVINTVADVNASGSVPTSFSGTADEFGGVGYSTPATVAVSVIKNGSSTHSGIATRSGTGWSINVASLSPALTIGDGSYEVLAQATDSAGNQSTIASETFSVDQTAPVISLDPIDELLNATEKTDLETSGLTVNGSVTGGTITSIVFKDETSNTIIDNTQTTLPASFSGFTLVDGHTYSVTVASSDTAGNPSSAAVSFLVDATPPMIDITDVDDFLDEFPLSFTGDAGDSDSVFVEISDGTSVVHSGTATIDTGDWTFDDFTGFTPVSGTEYTVSAVGTDEAGNESTAAETVFTFDTEVPTISTVTPSGTASVVVNDDSGTLEVVITFTEEMSQLAADEPSVTFSEDLTGILGTPSGAWNLDGDTFTLTYAVTDTNVEIADIDVTVTGGKDLAGNDVDYGAGTEYTETAAVNIDTLNPAVDSGSGPAAGTYYLGSQELKFTVEYDDEVAVTGTPVIQITVGGDPKEALYSAADSDLANGIVVFKYVPVSGDSGTVVVTNPSILPAPGASITDVNGNVASYNHGISLATVTVDALNGAALPASGSYRIKLVDNDANPDFETVQVSTADGSTIYLNPTLSDLSSGTGTISLFGEGASLIIDFINGNPIPSVGSTGGLVFDATTGGSVSFENVPTMGGPASASFDATTGVLSLDTDDITLAGVNSIDALGLETDDFTVSLGDVDNAVTLADEGTASDNAVALSGATIPTIKINSAAFAAGGLSVVGGDESDSLTITTNDLPVGAVSFDGGAQGMAGADAIVVDVDGATGETVTINQTAFGVGDVTLNDGMSDTGKTAFTGVETVSYAGAAENISVVVPGTTAEQLTLGVAGTVMSLVDEATSPASAPVSAELPSADLAISASTGDLVIDSPLSVVGDLSVQAESIAQSTSATVTAVNATFDAVGGDLTLEEDNEFTGTVDIDVTGGSATINDASDLDLGEVVVTGGTLTATAAGDLTSSTSIETTGMGTSKLSGGGAGKVTLKEVTITDDLEIVAGTGGVEIDAPVGTGTMSILGDLSIDSAGAVTVSNDGMTTSGAIDVTGDLTVTSGGDVTFEGPVEVEGETSIDATGFDVWLANAGNALSTLNVNANTADVVDSDFLTITGGVIGTQLNLSALFVGQTGTVISGAGSVTIVAGEALFNLANTYTGTTTVSSGTKLTIGNVDALDNSSDLVVSGELDVQDQAVVVNALTIDGGEINGSTGSLSSTATILAKSGTVNVPLGGDDGLTKTTAGTLTLSAGADYAGSTMIMGGTIQLDVDDALPILTSVSLADASGVTLDLNDRNQTLVALTGGSSTNGVVDLGTGTLSLESGSFDGAITGTGGITKTSSDGLILSGTSTYSGATDIQDGSLELNNAVLGATATSIGATATLTGKGTIGGSVTVEGNLNPTGTLNVGSLLLSDDSTFTVNLDEGTPTVSSTGAVTIGADVEATLTLTEGVDYGDPVVLISGSTVSGSMTGDLAMGSLVSGGATGKFYWPEYTSTSVQLAENVLATLTASSGGTSYTEDDPATIVDPGITASSTDENLENVENWEFRARITDATYVAGEDVLSYNLASSGFFVINDADPQELIITVQSGKSPSMATIQAGLRLIAYTNTNSVDPDETARVVEFSFFDGAEWSAVTSKTVTITGTDDAPVADLSLSSTSIAEGGSLVLNGTLSSDPEDDPITKYFWKVNGTALPTSTQSLSVVTINWATLVSLGVTDDTNGGSTIPISLSVLANGVTSPVDSATFEVTNTLPTIDIPVVTIDEVQGATFTANITDPVPADAVAPNYFWTINGYFFGTTAPSITLSWSDLNLAGVTNDGTFDVDIEFTANGDGAQNFTKVGGLVVNNVDPTASIDTAPLTMELDTEASFVGSGSDVNANDNLTYLWSVTRNSVSQTVSGNTSTNFNYTPTAPGNYVVTFAVNDGTDTTTDSVSYTVTGDVDDPTITGITSTTSDGAYNEGDDVNVTVTFDEPVFLSGGDLQITLDTGAVLTATVSGSTATATYTVGAGENSADLTVTGLSLTAGTLKDAAGNDADLSLPSGSNLGDNSDIVVDTTAPAAPTAGDLTANTTGTLPTLSGTATLLAGETLTVEVGGATYAVTGASWTLDLDTASPISGSLNIAAEGDYTITATATDLAGNSTSGTGTLTVDNTAPTAPTADDLTASTSGTLPTLTGSATLLAGETLTVSVGGATYTVASSGTWTLDLDTATPDSGTLSIGAEGDYTVVATTTDAAGNTNTGSGILTVDNTLPEIVDIKVASSAWSAAFLAKLGGGFSVVTNTRTVPWVNIDQIIVSFSEPVVVELSDFNLSGTGVSTTSLNAHPTEANTYIIGVSGLVESLFLSGPQMVNPVQLTLAITSTSIEDAGGNVLAAGATETIDVVPGDYDGNTFVNGIDGFYHTFEDGTDVGDTAFNIFADFDGDGFVGSLDAFGLSQRDGTGLS